MEQKINIAELLKDCPQGMELDCTMYEDCTFEGIEDVGYINILIKTPNGQMKLSKYGCFIHNCEKAKCVIFPKGKTTWEGFQGPFKDGDVVTTTSGIHTFILQIAKSNTEGYCYIGYDSELDAIFHAGVWNFKRLATEEEKEKFFKVIKDNGYKWNAETKTLEKLIEPKFKVGDKIKSIFNNTQYIITDLTDTHYTLVEVTNKFKYIEPIIEDKNWELVQSKFDINTLVPFESRVLVRDFNDEEWCPAIWGVYGYGKEYPHIVVGGNKFIQCIPYEGNEHLLDTTNDCDEFYKTWK